MSGKFVESDVEEAALTWLAEMGYARVYGPDIEPEGRTPERASFQDVILQERLIAALRRINPGLAQAVIEEAARMVSKAATGDLIQQNRHVHQLLTNGVTLEEKASDGSLRGHTIRLLDFARPENNDWLAVNQMTVMEGKNHRRPDITLFVNGLPIAVIELKNPLDASATIQGAFNQLQTYKSELPTLFYTNALLIVSDGIKARMGSLTGDWSRFMPWRTIDGRVIAAKGAPELEVTLKGICDPARLLDLIRYFIVFEADGAHIEKKIAAYHQYHAVNKAIASTLEASAASGDKRVGVVWHTQGSGKSLSMVFYAGKIAQQPEMANPTLVIITDRNDLDDQLYDTFAACQELLRQTPQQAEYTSDLHTLLKVASGGIVFTTIQKFQPEERGRYPVLSERRNIIVIADEAHRSQYDFIDGFARHIHDALPNASFIGFTGTPIEQSDRTTTAVFGDYIDIYDIQRAVEDGATVSIYYEGRLAKLELDASETPHIDKDFEEITEGEEEQNRQRLRTKWARLEAIVGAQRRIKLIAQDIVNHWEARSAALEGKAMIVCMSRRICVELYQAIVALKPEWHSDDDETGALKVVMTGSATDPLDWQPHIRKKSRRKALAKRFKDPDNGLQLVIVRDMWLTGFDAPSLHTMYLDKPMRGHGLMQTIARVNRVFKDKPGGLIVDYLGLADQLKLALADYTQGDQKEVDIPQAVAVRLMQEKFEIARQFYHGFNYTAYATGSAPVRLGLLGGAINHILGQPDGKKRYLKAVTELSKAFALAVPADEALAIRDDVSYFQAVRALLVKSTPEEWQSKDDLDTAVRQLVSRAVAPDKVIDIFDAAGLRHPNLAILDDAFLDEVREMPRRNLALEVLQKLLNDQIKARAQHNVVDAKSFREKLEQAMLNYQNRALDTAQIIDQLIQMAKDLREAHKRGEDLGLTEDELAFYDALEVSDSAVKVLGDDTLKTIARELVQAVKANVTIDWAVRESARAKLRTIVKRLLRKYGYPPDKQEQATNTVIEQAEALSQMWVG